MAIEKLTSGVDQNDLSASTGADVANSVNALIDQGAGILKVTQYSYGVNFSDHVTGAIIKKSERSVLRQTRAASTEPKMRDLSSVVSGVTATVRSLANSIAAGFTTPYSPVTSCKILGCATEISSSANMHYALTSYPQRAIVGMESLVFGNKVSFRFFARDPIAAHYWILVNDKPASLTPTEYTAGGYFAFTAIDVDLPNTGPNIVTIYASNVAGFVGVGMPNTGAALPSERALRKVAITGDSFVAGTAMNGSSFDSFAGILAVRYGYDVLNNGYGGTGYVNDGGTGIQKTFSNESRVKNVKLFEPDEHLLFGSVNDNGLDGVEGAVNATIAAYRAEWDCITTVVGVQPTGTDKTLSSSLATARSVRSASVNNPLVDRYLDPIGCADSELLPPAFAAGTYQPNDRVIVQNAVWALDSDVSASFAASEGPLGTSAASKVHRWRQLTKWLYGSGNATSGSYTRLLMLGSDNTHYTPAGNAAIAVTVDSILRS